MAGLDFTFKRVGAVKLNYGLSPINWSAFHDEDIYLLNQALIKPGHPLGFITRLEFDRLCMVEESMPEQMKMSVEQRRNFYSKFTAVKYLVPGRMKENVATMRHFLQVANALPSLVGFH